MEDPGLMPGEEEVASVGQLRCPSLVAGPTRCGRAEEDVEDIEGGRRGRKGRRGGCRGFRGCRGGWPRARM